MRNDKYIGVYRYADVVVENAIPPSLTSTCSIRYRLCIKHNFSFEGKKQSEGRLSAFHEAVLRSLWKPYDSARAALPSSVGYIITTSVQSERESVIAPRRSRKKTGSKNSLSDIPVHHVLTDENI